MDAGFVHDAVRLILDALAALVADDILLVGQRLGGHLLEEIPHPIRLEPQCELHLVGRHGLEVVGAIEIGRAVQIGGAGPFKQLDVLIGRTCFEPWNIMCSKRCANPVRPGSSFAGPT